MNISERLCRYGNYIHLLDDFGTESRDVKQSFQIIKDIMKIIEDNVENLHSYKFLPMSYLFKQLCKVNNEITEEIS